MSDTSSWDCKTCYLRNNSKRNECQACFTAKPYSANYNWELYLVPSAKELYFILHDIFCYQYKLMPKLYEDTNHLSYSSLMGYADDYHSILYLISCIYLNEKERNLINLHKIIKIGIDKNNSLTFLTQNNVTQYIIREIAEYSNYKPFQLDKNILSKSQYTQLSFNDASNEVIFDKPDRDFINIKNNENLLDFSCNGQCIIDSYVLGCDDEMWIGIMDKSQYKPCIDIEYESNSLLYYYKNAIHAFGRSDYMKLDCKYDYEKHDWISFCVDINRKKVTFYKNKEKVIEICKIPACDHLVYAAVVDEQDDGFFVERVLFQKTN